MKTRTFLKLVAFLPLMLVLASPAIGQGQAPNRVDVLIGFVSPPTPEDVTIVQAAGGQVRFVYSIVPAVAVTVPEPALRGLARDHRVRYIEADAPVYATSQTVPWGVDRVFGNSTPDSTWATASRGRGIKVAVLDTGISAHRDLAVAGGWNYWGGQPHDGHGHGTHVAGTIAALNNSVDVVGVAPDVSLYAVKVLYDNGAGSVSSVVAGMDWAVANGMDIVNMSLGMSTWSRTMEMAMDNAFDDGSGILIIASAGNEGNSQGTGDYVGYPAKYKSVIAVAASDVNDQRASFSSTGPDVEITAPGVDILSTYPPYTDTFGPPNRRQTYYTRTLSGTSMASPHVAGVAALIMAANPGLNAGQVRQILEQTAVPLGTTTWYGYGLVMPRKLWRQPWTLRRRYRPRRPAWWPSPETGRYNSRGTNPAALLLTRSTGWTRLKRALARRVDATPATSILVSPMKPLTPTASGPSMRRVKARRRIQTW
jgi:subtilisin